MNKQFTDRARRALALAADEARSFNHDYVGTEHVLLALIAEQSGVASHVLQSLGVDLSRIRAEIEKLILPNSTPVPIRALPRTPRANQVIEYARDEAQSVGQKTVDVEHLLIGLLREREGVAGIVLGNLGVKSKQLRAEALRTRIELMKIVERTVRPIRSSTSRKRIIREELLAHIATIYEEELARRGEPAAALHAASDRFGAPSELAREFEVAQPFHERVSYFTERFVAYRAPESAARYSLRMACHTLLLLAMVLSLVTFGVYLRYGWIQDVKTLSRVLGAIALLTPPAQFLVWLTYLKMRDAMWGAFGSRKSLVHVLALNALIAAVAQLYLIGVAATARLDLNAALDAARQVGVIAVISALAFVVLAYISGPGEIRDAQWALLDIESVQ